jgi:hypothetical protein
VKGLIGLALLSLAVTLPAEATVARTAQYRSGKAATGLVRSALGSYEGTLLEPSGGDATGYATGAGVVATGAQPGIIDVTKPWLVFSHDGPDGALACFSMSNVTKVATVEEMRPGNYMLIDQTTTTKEALVVARVACDDGTDTEVTLWWYKPRAANAPQQWAWKLPFVGRQGDPYGSAMIHGLDHDAYFWVCGDASPCAEPVAQSFLRVYDANLTVAR